MVRDLQEIGGKFGRIFLRTAGILSDEVALDRAFDVASQEEGFRSVSQPQHQRIIVCGRFNGIIVVRPQNTHLRVCPADLLAFGTMNDQHAERSRQ
jgi:hypothetical protein